MTKRIFWLLVIGTALAISASADMSSAGLIRTKHHVQHHHAHRAVKHHQRRRAHHNI